MHLDVPVPENPATQRERMRQRTVDAPMLQELKETVEMVRSVSHDRVGGMSEQHRLVVLDVLFRSWTWTNTTIAIARIRRKRA